MQLKEINPSLNTDYFKNSICICLRSAWTTWMVGPINTTNQWVHTYIKQRIIIYLQRIGHNFTYIKKKKKKIHAMLPQCFFDNSGSRWLVSSSLDVGISLLPDSNSERESSSCLCFDSLLKMLGLFSCNGDSDLGVSFKLWTCCRQTWTASCTRTKNHCLPIRSTTPDLVRVSSTSRFGLEIAIWNRKQTCQPLFS